MTAPGFLWGYHRRHLAWLLAALLAMPVYSLASLGIVALIEPVFADVLLAGPGPTGGMTALSDAGAAPAVPASHMSGSRVPRLLDLRTATVRAYEEGKRAFGVDGRTVVFFTPFLALVVFLVRGLADFAGAYAFQRVGLGVATSIRNDLYRRFLDQSARFHSAHPSGELMSRVISDVSLLQNALSSRLFDLIQQALTLFLLVALLLSTNLGLALLVLLGAPGLVQVLRRFGRAARRSSGRAQVRMAEVSSLLSEGLRGHAVVQVFNAQAYEHRRFTDATRRHLRVALRLQRLHSLAPFVVEGIAVLTASVFLVYAGLQIRAGVLSAPLLVQFLANTWLLYDPVRKLSSANLALQQTMAAAERMVAVMTEPNLVEDPPGAVRLDQFRDRVVFDQVSVAYGARKVVNRVTLEIRRGEVVALVGPSGAGKTTLASLLPRLLDPDEGRVLVDGHDVRTVSLHSLRALVGVVTQHTVLFDDTIRNNIAYGGPEVPLDAVRRAARAARADEFIAAQPASYDTRIGESGLRLSGGERQRIAIARALLKNAPILILDEATSQLDSESEALVHQALSNLIEGRTVLVIAHHLSTVQRADRIVVMDGGRIIEQGRHEHLIAAAGTYRRLYERWTADMAGA